MIYGHLIYGHLIYTLILKLKDCLFGAVNLTKNADPDRYSYSGYGIGFNSPSHFLFSKFDFGKNVITFGVENNSSTHTDNKEKYILVFGEGPTQGLDNTTITAEAKYSINFTASKKKCI